MNNLEFRAYPKSRWAIERHGLVMLYGDDKIGDACDNDHLNGFIADCLQNYYLMQWTGLKDKNGVKIFEGDVVEWVDHVDGTTNGVVVRLLSDFVLKTKCVEYNPKIPIDPPIDYFSLSSIYEMQDDDDSVEVIGNIYENPELINDK